MNLLNKNMLTMAVTTAITSVAIFVSSDGLAATDSAAELPPPPIGPFVAQEVIPMSSSQTDNAQAGNVDAKTDGLAAIGSPVKPEAPQELAESLVPEKAPNVPVAPDAPQSDSILVPAAEGLSHKKSPVKLAKPEQPNVAGASEAMTAPPTLNSVAEGAPDAPKAPATPPKAPDAPSINADEKAESRPVMNVQMPTAPEMPEMQMPIMAPNMQMKIHRPVMDTSTMQAPTMEMPAMPEMVVPELSAPQPLVPPAPVDAAQQPPTPPTPVMAPEKTENTEEKQ